MAQGRGGKVWNGSLGRAVKERGGHSCSISWSRGCVSFQSVHEAISPVSAIQELHPNRWQMKME